MPACDAYIPEGTLPPSPGGRVVTLPGIAARLIGYAARRCSAVHLSGAASGRTCWPSRLRGRRARE